MKFMKLKRAIFLTHFSITRFTNHDDKILDLQIQTIIVNLEIFQYILQALEISGEMGCPFFDVVWNILLYQSIKVLPSE